MSIEVLPPEIVERILLSSRLTPRDIVNFSKTCKRFFESSDSDEVWREIFSRQLKDVYVNLNLCTNISWKCEYVRYVKTILRSKSCLSCPPQITDFRYRTVCDRYGFRDR
jgi:hypothetical protein